MDKILFKGLNLNHKSKKPRSYKISNFTDHNSVNIFTKQFQNILYPFCKSRENVVIENYLSRNKIDEIIEVLQYIGYKNNIVYNRNLDMSSLENISYIIIDDIFDIEKSVLEKVSCNFVIFTNKKNILFTNFPHIKFLYRHKFINGTKENIKHLLIDQLVFDPSESVIYTNDKNKLKNRFENIKIVDDSELKDDFCCKRFIFYDLCDNINTILERIQWQESLTIYSIFVLNEKDKLKKLIDKIKDKVVIDKEIYDFLAKD